MNVVASARGACAGWAGCTIDVASAVGGSGFRFGIGTIDVGCACAIAGWFWAEFCSLTSQLPFS
jgi:hypothetical protein